MHDVLAGREKNYLLPFFWQHGAKEPVLRTLMAKIDASCVKEVCVESRPHPDFCGPRWFHDLDIILDEAGMRGMRVWVLDDKQFPTGFAGGLIETKYPQHRRRMLDYFVIDACGPDAHASFLPGSLLRDDDELVAVVASRRLDGGKDWRRAKLDLSGDLIDLTGRVNRGRLYWPVPDGLWSLVVVYTTYRCKNARSLHLLNPISPAAVDVLIEGSYEPHYRRYSHLFGTTFAGFFSDEPTFTNTDSVEALIGRRDMQLPWSQELHAALTDRFGFELRRYLPCLWFAAGVHSQEMRFAYMDRLTALYSEHFNQRLANWCHAHGVEYIGHVIEDLNQHARLGSGVGHYFRALSGQDMAGVDIVMHQIHPGYDQITSRWHGGNKTLDGEFFHYALIKLASSLGHIDPRKQGRTLCENYGAYGWMEGLRLMKWLTDHCLVRGVNHFTPHAFTDSAFPEWDSPPHFYAQGNNPQYRFLGRLFRYTNRLCHLFSDGKPMATALVLYHAEAEWWGDAMLIQEPMRELMQRQIDLDVAPCDSFLTEVQAVNGQIRLNGESYRCLIIPKAEALPGSFLDSVRRLRAAGVPIFFVDGYPAMTSEGSLVGSPETLGELVALADLAARVIAGGYPDIRIKPVCRRLRAYHYQRGNADYYLFFNEEPRESLAFTAQLPAADHLAVYDAMENRLLAIRQDGNRVTLNLDPYQSIVLVDSPDSLPICADYPDTAALAGIEITGPWDISLATCAEYPAFKPWKSSARAGDINAEDEKPDFSGTVRYEGCFSLEQMTGKLYLKLRSVYETAEVWINGQYAGWQLSTPYLFDLAGLACVGKNRLVIEVTNTLAKQVADYSSAIVKQEPGGMLENPLLLLGQSTDSPTFGPA